MRRKPHGMLYNPAGGEDPHLAQAIAAVHDYDPSRTDTTVGTGGKVKSRRR